MIFKELSAELQKQLDALKAILNTDLRDFNALLAGVDVPPVEPKQPQRPK